MKKLELIFENEAGKSVTYSLDEPVEPVDTEAVIHAMDEIINQNVFITRDGPLVAKRGARIVERTVTDIQLDE